MIWLRAIPVFAVAVCAFPRTTDTVFLFNPLIILVAKVFSAVAGYESETVKFINDGTMIKNRLFTSLPSLTAPSSIDR